MSDVIPLFHGGTNAPDARIANPTMVAHLEALLAMAKAGEIASIATVSIARDGPVILCPNGCIVPSVGDARMILGCLEEAKAVILRTIDQQG